MRFSPLAVLMLCLVALAAPAAAHPITGTGAGLGAGFMHPLGGLDHVLAMVAVGVWAAQLGGRALWLVPTAFVAMMLAGGALAAAGGALPAMDIGVLGSVLLLGLMIAFAVRAPVALGMAVVGAFALCHGHVHGSEMPTGAGALYALGFAAATAALHGVGIGFAEACRARAVRWSGAGIAAAGLALMVASWTA
jgi:urease accessory protein